MGIFTRDSYLESAEMRERLLSEKIDTILIDRVLQMFWFKDSYNSLISYKPYFEIFITYIKAEGNNFNLISFYEYLLKTLLPDHYKELDGLALIYEQTHLNQIEESLFDNIFKKKKYPFTKKALVSSGIMEIVSDEKTKKTYIGWKHHRLSEYIVANMFLNSKNPISEFEKHAIFSAESIKAIKPSWLGVYYFLSQTNVREDLLKWTVKFLEENENSITEDIAEYITNIDGLSEGLRTKIFNLVYTHYKAKEIWFPVWARVGLGKVATPEVLSTLEEDIKEQEYFERTYNYRGNVVSIIDSVLENNADILTLEKKEFWRNSLVEFAKSKDERGVLHRHCLSALTNYKDASSLIPQLVNIYNEGDTLVKQAYIQFCYTTDPNSIDTINILLKSMVPSTDIYARHGLYEVNSYKGVHYLLNKLIENPDILAFLIDRESIFNGDDDKGDQQLINNITFVLDTNTKEILPLLENLLMAVPSATKDLYQLDKSYILKSLAILVSTRNPSFWKKILGDFIKNIEPKSNIWAKWDKYEDILVWFINENNLEEIHTTLSKVEKGDQIFDFLVRRNEWRTGDTLVVEKAAELGFVERINASKIPYDDTDDIYEKFKNLLEPSPGKYNPEVFAFYLRNYEKINSRIEKDKEAKAKVKKLIFESNLNLIDPQELKVTYEDPVNKKGSYRISSIHFYYGNLLRLANKLYPTELKKYRQQFIDYIPFAFDEDLQTILELAPNIKEEELNFVFATLLNKKKDIRYLVPQTFSYFVSEYLEENIIYSKFSEILQSFISDSLIDDYVKRSSLRNLVTIDTKLGSLGADYFKKLFKSDTFLECAEIANKALISIYHEKSAITWRISKIKDTLVTTQKYIPPKSGEVHEVSSTEHELADLEFASALFSLPKEYYTIFIELLRYAIDNDSSKTQTFVEYIWKITITYIEKLSAIDDKVNTYEKLLADVDAIVKERKELNWFYYALDRLRTTIINYSDTDSINFSGKINDR